MKAAVIILSVIMLFSMPTVSYAEGEMKDIYDGLPDGVEELLPKDFEDEIERNDGTSAVGFLTRRFSYRS